MWLDRFPGLATPTESPASHTRSRSPASPAPRRTTHLTPAQRSGIGLAAGTSSLSLGLSSNDSNVSLPITSRVPNGSSLKQEQRPPPTVPDPLKILRSILGTSSTDQSHGDIRQGHGATQRPDTLAADIDFGDLSLEEYVKDEEGNGKGSCSPVAQQANSGEEGKRYSKLHESIKGCDGVLGSVESYLANFEKELGAVSSEIESLQTRSTQLTTKLENRKKVEKLIGPAVEEISISPTTVKTISERAVDERWIDALSEIESRSAAIEKKDLGPVKAVEDVKPLLEDLKAKASERIRDFLVAQIKALRSPNVDAQMIQQQKLIRYKYLYAFLARSQPALADQIGQAYINTMKWYYSSNFTRYQQALEKLPLHIIEQSEVLGGGSGGGSDSTSYRRNGLGTNKNTSPQHDAFNLGRRAEVLKAKAATAMASYSAEAEQTNRHHHYLETPFYNFNLALLDNVCVEFSTTTELFISHSSHKTLRDISRTTMPEIFEPTFALGHAFTKQLIASTADCLGILLCVRLNQHFAFELQRRRVPVADSYINGINMLLWPRFQILMDAHCDSLRRLNNSSTASSRGAAAVAAAFSLTNTSSPPNTNPGTITTTKTATATAIPTPPNTTTTTTTTATISPHPLTQKFARFLHALLSLSTDPSAADEPTSHSLSRLRSEYESLMLRLAWTAAATAAGTTTTNTSSSTTSSSGTATMSEATKRNKFLYYNYSLVLTILADLRGKLAQEVRARFEVLVRECAGAGR